MEQRKRENILKSLLELDGIGETQISAIKNFLDNKMNIKITKDLINQLNIKEYISKNTSGKFSNKKIMFTGGFKNMSRSEAKSIAERKGGKVLGSISKKLDYLSVGDLKPTKKKIDQAKNMKIKIILENEWNKILER